MPGRAHPEPPGHKQPPRCAAHTQPTLAAFGSFKGTWEESVMAGTASNRLSAHWHWQNHSGNRIIKSDNSDDFKGALRDI